MGSSLSAFNIFYYTSNSVGFIFSLLGFATFLSIYRHAPSLVNRTTLRLQAALCFVDFLIHLRLFCDGHYSPGVCSFVGFIGVYLASLSLIITTSINLCFHLNLLSAKKVEAKVEKLLWYAILVLPILHTVPPYVLGNFGSDENGFCFLKSDMKYHDFMIFYLLVVPKSVVFAYCLLIVFLIVMRVKGVNDVLAKILDDRKVDDENKNLLERIFDSWMSRFILYPLSFIAINSGLIVGFIFKSLQIQSQAVLYWTVLGLYFSGLVHYVCLMCDPYFQDALFDIILFKWEKISQRFKKELKDEIALMESATRKQDSCHGQGSVDNFCNWDEDEAKALLKECTKRF